MMSRSTETKLRLTELMAENWWLKWYLSINRARSTATLKDYLKTKTLKENLRLFSFLSKTAKRVYEVTSLSAGVRF
jgi:hypothetical protein